MRKAFVSSLAKRGSFCRPRRATTTTTTTGSDDDDVVVRCVSFLSSSSRASSGIASSAFSSLKRTKLDQNVTVRPLSTREGFVENLITTFPSSARTKKRTIRTTSRGFASASADTVKSGDDDDDFGDDDNEEDAEERKKASGGKEGKAKGSNSSSSTTTTSTTEPPPTANSIIKSKKTSDLEPITLQSLTGDLSFRRRRGGGRLDADESGETFGRLHRRPKRGEKSRGGRIEKSMA